MRKMMLSSMINEAVIKKTEFSCVRSKIIITSVSTVVFLITVVSIWTCFMYYRKRQKKKGRRRDTFIDDFKRGNVPEKYLCFVSYSSEDNEDIKQVCALIKQSL
jgi:hypothetical protein